MKNKIISIFVLLCMLSSFITVSAASAQDLSSMDILRAMEVLSGDPDGNMRPGDPVTRAEFAKMSVLLSPHKNKVAKNVKISVFTDCTASHWASPYVKVAAENNIIQGYPSGLFCPDEGITYVQAITVALRLLGYTDEDFGYTYPEGQLGMAQTLKLGAGISAGANDNLTRLEVAKLFVNMLTTSPKSSGVDYIVSLGYSLIDDCVIVATHSENASVATGKVHTSQGEYDINDSFDTSLVGHKGKALVTREGRLITLFKSTYSAEELVVYSSGTSLVSVYDGNRITSLSPDSDTPCYMNLQRTTFASLRQSLCAGDKLIVARQSDGSVEHIIVGDTDLDGPYTAGEGASLPSFIPEDCVNVIRNGEKSTQSQIKENDIIYYAPSVNAIFAYSKKISGIYSKAIPNTSSPQSVVVGGVTYKIESPLAFSKLSSLSGYKEGDHIVLLLGVDGGVADVLSDKPKEASVSTDVTMQIQQGSHSKEVALLDALGAIDADTFDASAPLKRGEFAKMIAMSSPQRLKVSLGSKLSVFPDCTYDYWATPYVKVAVENSYMSSLTTGYFMPEENISYASVLDSCLRLLGYGSSDLPDWPSSQIALAYNIGITENMQPDANAAITKGDAAIILYNTLCTPQKNGTKTAIEATDHSYYEECVIVASSQEDGSVSSGKIKTSEGTFSIDVKSFDTSDVGKLGELLVCSDKIVMFNPKNTSYTQAPVYSSLSGGLALMTDDGILGVALADNTITYAGAEKQTFGRAKDLISMGDTATVYYDDRMRAEYVYVNTKSLSGPYVYLGSSWYTSVSGASASTTLMKNGQQTDRLELYDIIYYSPSIDTAFVYDDKVIGILEDASPSKTAPDTITVSGVTYQVSSLDAIGYDIDYGDTLTICLGKDSKAAYTYLSSDKTMAGYLTATGVKSFKNAYDETYTSRYVSLVLPDGSRVDCATDSDYSNWINTVMTISFDDGMASLSAVSNGSQTYGTVDADKMTIGGKKVSDDVKILDVGYVGSSYPCVYTPVYLSRLDGASLSSSQVLYSKIENGAVTELILKDATGDAFSYGVVMSAKTNLGSQNSSSISASGTYSVDIAGSVYTYSGGAVTNVQKGSVVKTAMSGNRIEYLSRLSPKSVSIQSCDYTSITLKNGTGYLLADDVVVYKLTGNQTYTLLPVSELYDNLDDYSYSSVYIDSDRVRVIILK